MQLVKTTKEMDREHKGRQRHKTRLIHFSRGSNHGCCACPSSYNNSIARSRDFVSCKHASCISDASQRTASRPGLGLSVHA